MQRHNCSYRVGTVVGVSLKVKSHLTKKENVGNKNVSKYKN